MLWVHAATDLLIAFAYFLVPVVLFYYLRTQKDLKFRWVLVSFALFCILGGVIHVFRFLAPWHRVYILEGIVKVVAAISALFAISALWWFIPKLIESRVTERDKVRASLEEKETYFQTLMEGSSELLIILDGQGKFRFMGPSLERTLGYRQGSLIGGNLTGLIHPNDVSKAKELISRRRETVEFQTFDLRFRHQDGSWRVLKISVRNLLRYPHVNGILIHGQDITEQRRAEEQLRLIPMIMQDLGKTADFHSALEIAIRKICEVAGWDYGEVWIPRSDGKVLECGPSWYGRDQFEEFHRISRELRFPPNLGLPGRVWISKEAEWIDDVSLISEASFFPIQIAQEAGVKAALGVPMVVDGQVLAVVVFLLSNSKSQDKRLVDLVTTVTTQLGSVVQRKRAEEALREVHEQVEKRIRERTKEITQLSEALKSELDTIKKREEFLRKTQENFLTLVNSIDGIVWEFDLAASRFSFISQQTERILGYPVETWFQEPTFWQDHIHGGDREAAVAFRAQVAQKKEANQFEYRMITTDGQTIWLRDMVTVVVENGEATKLRGVMVNITESKQVAEALNQERNFVSAVLDTASALVMILDTEGRVARFNRACEQTSGYKADEVRGEKFWDLFLVAEEVEKIKVIFARLLAGQFPTNYESHWVAKDKSQRVIAWSNTVLLSRHGTVVHIIATGVDITKSKEVEEKLKDAVQDLARSNEELDHSSRELKKANQQLRELDAMKSHFISAASHELRTPLTSIKGYVEAVLQDEVGPINEKQKEFLGYVKESTDRLHRLLNELLDISKIESGQVKMDKELTNLGDLLREEVLIFKPQANKKGLTLDIETDIHLKEIYCDADKVREVMDNLVSNAIKYTLKGGKIKVYARNYETGVQINVQDTGIGIKKEDLARIFEPFQHIEKVGAEDEESTGLGLTLVKRIVAAHQGDVRIRSQEGSGSTFTVFLPQGTPSETTKDSPWVTTNA